MKKKLICILLIIIFIFNILCENLVYAENLEYSKDNSDSMLEDGTAEVGTNKSKKSVKPNDSMMDSVANIFTAMLNPIPGIVAIILNLIVGEDFSIEKTVFNKIDLFNINFFDLEATSSDGNKVLKGQVPKWFHSIKNLAIALNLLILIYIGIRMAISTIASEQAKYKKMLIGWLEGFIIIFILQYIMIITLKIGESLLSLLASSYTIGNTEKGIINNIFNTKKGFSFFLPSVVYWILIFYQVKFFCMYLKRLLTVGFLIIISPLITVTYAIDKIGDQKPQIFSNWMKEYIANVLIQPLHAFLYLIFIVSTDEIVQIAPVVFILFLIGLSRGENVFRSVFALDKLFTIKNMKDTFKASDIKIK